MNEQDENLIIAALVARAGGKVAIQMHELARLYNRRISVTRLPAGRGIQITVEMPPPAPNVLEDQPA